ncbi:enoyl-CoA hydratase/isomerase family protein [Tumebacillus sp. DT12]|uniref:Ethylmalonyl-CoA decarboxylase n=1 Tax=Tumebacillus lacus TaxID=2995335 RepID=A0ABT3X1B2_9BACL|nr:enoyl-CoA hydratase/isomerase family protein [Tumebacillus lacus]MCX7570722.1 enoyl-CoA hydratase/isomerase family protein [Tumebacillus lacus]
MNDVVKYEKIADEHLAVLRIDRPEASNAISTAVMEGLAAALEQARQDDDVRAVILTGTGDRVFVSGGDLKEFHADLTDEERVYEKMSQMRRVLETIHLFPKPVIAAVNGAARGGGGEVASACHFRVGADTATVGFIQVKLGIAPGWGGGVLLSKIVGRQKALALILRGDIIDARAAMELGFFDIVCPQDEILHYARMYAKPLTANSPKAVQSLLRLLREQESLPVTDAMERESRLCAQLWGTPEHDAAVSSFLSRKARKE